MQNVTDEQIDAIYGDSPFCARRTIDKTRYEVIRRTNEDWREVVSNDAPEHHGYLRSFEDAERHRRRLHVRWVFSNKQ